MSCRCVCVALSFRRLNQASRWLGCSGLVLTMTRRDLSVEAVCAHVGQPPAGLVENPQNGHGAVGISMPKCCVMVPGFKDWSQPFKPGGQGLEEG